MQFIIILIATALLQLLAPWWVIALVPFLVFLWRPTSSSSAFFIGFAAVAAVWLVYGLYMHVSSGGIMSNRIAAIFSLPGGIPLLAVTGLIGGLAGAVSALAGSLTGKLFNTNTGSTQRAS